MNVAVEGILTISILHPMQSCQITLSSAESKLLVVNSGIHKTFWAVSLLTYNQVMWSVSANRGVRWPLLICFVCRPLQDEWYPCQLAAWRPNGWFLSPHQGFQSGCRCSAFHHVECLLELTETFPGIRHVRTETFTVWSTMTWTNPSSNRFPTASLKV